MKNKNKIWVILLLMAFISSVGIYALKIRPDDRAFKSLQPRKRIELWWEKRHAEKVRMIREQKVDLLMVGDSIVQGWEHSGKLVWDRYYGNKNAFNLGFSGDCTEHVIWRIQNGEVAGISPRVAVLMIGTNNTAHREEPAVETAAGIKGIIEQLQIRLPQTKILLIAIFPRQKYPDDLYRMHNRQINNFISQYADNKKVFFLDLNKYFLDENGILREDIMPDLLHPNLKGYLVWARSMEPSIKRLMYQN